jgi:hypothetical protein
MSSSYASSNSLRRAGVAAHGGRGLQERANHQL